jgi:hypothetical protein
MEDKMIESIAFVLPAVVTGMVAYYMFTGFINNKNTEKQMELLANRKQIGLPIKLQACERLILFCDRINPVKMLLRIPPISANTNTYLHLLIANIDQEFEHNLVQQIYISEDTWTAICAAKNAVTNKLRSVAETSKTANDLRENVLIDYSKVIPPTETAIAFIKNEVKKLL